MFFALYESYRDQRFSKLLKSGAGWTVWFNRQARIFGLDGQAGVCIVQPLRESLHGGGKCRVARVALAAQKPQRSGPYDDCNGCRRYPECCSPPDANDDTRPSSRICWRLASRQRWDEEQVTQQLSAPPRCRHQPAPELDREHLALGARSAKMSRTRFDGDFDLPPF